MSNLPPNRATPSSSLRRAVFDVIEGGQLDQRGSRVFDAAMVTLILLNVAAFVAETVPSIERDYGGWLGAFETFSVAVFTIEYAARLWTAVEMPYLSRRPAWQARLHLATRPSLIIDLLAIVPFYLSFLLTIDLRFLRILRILRFLKLSRYSPALHTLARVLYTERKALVGAGLLLLAAVLFASSGIYFLEGQVQPDKFGSVPAASWWAIATLTTVGYGDMVPMTTLGKLFGGLVMICGLCILALPVAIVSTGFAQEVGRRDFVITWSLMSRISILADLEASEVAAIMPLLHALNLPPHVELVGSGTMADAMYFVASGSVVEHAPYGDTRYGAGDVIGIAAALAADRYAASYVTVSRVRLLKLYRADFNRRAAASPPIAERLKRLALERAAAEQAALKAAAGSAGMA